MTHNQLVWHLYHTPTGDRYYRGVVDLPDSIYHGIVMDINAPWNKIIATESAKSLLESEGRYGIPKDALTDWKIPGGVLVGYTSDSVQYHTQRKRKNKTKAKSSKQPRPKPGKRAKKDEFLRRGILCCYCEQPLTDSIFTWEHLVPVSLGGNNSDLNKRPSCKRCNHERANRTLIEYICFLMGVPQNERVLKVIENAYEIEQYIIENRDKLMK